MPKLTEKQKRFCDYYIETGNATEAYKKAGYKNYSSSGVEANKTLNNPKIRAYIDSILKEKDKDRIASQDEVLEFLTAVARGQITEEMVCPDGAGGVFRENKNPNVKDRIKAAELLGKRYRLFVDKIEHEGIQQVQIIDDIPEESETDE